MTDVLRVSSDWLTLREAEDARARSRGLAHAVLPLLPSGPFTVHDLGSGTGSMMRWLAPLLPGPQTWVLHDWNADLLRDASDGPRPRDRAGMPVSLRPRVGSLEHLDGDDLRGASLVTASALLDVLTAAEAHAIVDACVTAGTPALLSLSVTGEVHLRPRDARDKTVERAFNDHQQQERNGRRLLGRYGAPIVQGLFAREGWRVRKAVTTWQLDDDRPRLLGEWFEGWVDAAEEQSPELRETLSGYRRLRRDQQARGELSALVYHLDLLAWPR